MTFIHGGFSMLTTAGVILAAGIRYVIAYIDPGTGSLILQLLLGGIAGGWVMIKLFGRRIASMLGLSKKGSEKEDADSSGDSSRA